MASQGRPVRFRVVPQEEGTMLAQLLARRLPKTTVPQARELVKAGAVYMGHLRVRVATVRVAAGERITVYPEALVHEELPLELVQFVHRDPSFVVLDKPAGVPVAATKQTARGTLAEALRRQLEREGMLRPYVGLVHRLDQGASGLVMFTIRSVANKSLHKQFVDHTIRRTYRVLVRGEPPEAMTCEQPLREVGNGSVEVAAPGDARARSAATSFRRLLPSEPVPEAALVEAELSTGRTHQIRVHAAALGHPVLGDRRYGPETPGAAERLYLHAARLEFAHPIDGATVVVHATLPGWARSLGDPIEAPDRASLD